MFVLERIGSVEPLFEEIDRKRPALAHGLPGGGCPLKWESATLRRPVGARIIGWAEFNRPRKASFTLRRCGASTLGRKTLFVPYCERTQVSKVHPVSSEFPRSDARAM